MSEKNIPFDGELSAAYADYCGLFSQYTAAAAELENVKAKRFDFLGRMKSFVDSINDEQGSSEEIRRQLQVYLDEDAALDAELKKVTDKLQAIEKDLTGIKVRLAESDAEAQKLLTLLQKLKLSPPAPREKQ